MDNRLAQVTNPLLKSDVQSLEGAPFFSRLLSALLGFAIVGGIVIFAFKFFSGALSWMTAGGDQNKVANAKSTVTNASIGVVTLLFSFFIINIVSCVVGVNLINFSLGELQVSSGGGTSCSGFNLVGGGDGGGTGTPTPIPPTIAPTPTGTPANITGVVSYNGGIDDYFDTDVPYVWVVNDQTGATFGGYAVENVDMPSNVEGRYYFLVDEDDGAGTEYTYTATACFNDGTSFYIGTRGSIDPEGTEVTGVNLPAALFAHIAMNDVGPDSSLCPFSYPGPSIP